MEPDEAAFWLLGALGLWVILAGRVVRLPVLGARVIGLVGTILLGID